MKVALRTSIRLETGLRVDPKLMVASTVIQQSSQELQQLIEVELNENPALERLDDHDAGPSDESILKIIAPHELKPKADDRELLRSLPHDDFTPDWVELAPCQTTLGEHIAAQLLPRIPDHLRVVGEFVIGCLDHNGYLYEGVEEIALGAACTIEEAEQIVKRLQQCDPAGVGAGGIQEALMLQLRSDNSFEAKLARRVVAEHLDLFASGKKARICKLFKAPMESVETIWRMILDCNPFPGDAYRAGQFDPASRMPAIQPDVILTRSEQGWEIAVRGPASGDFVVNTYYQERLAALDGNSSTVHDEKRHLSLYVQRANNFIDALEQRRRTLRLIGEYLVNHQSGFVTTGDPQFLLPLTRATLATEVGLHESTISRATREKFIQIETGETLPFEVFFKPALRVQRMIEEILAIENPENPLSDDQIAKLLAERGVHVARRTVNKYRDRTRLLSSRKRRAA